MRPSRMRLNSLLGTVDPLHHRRALLTPGASPGTMGDLEGWSFRPSSPCDALSGHPVLERPHRLVEGGPPHRPLPRPPDQPRALIRAAGEVAVERDALCQTAAQCED